MILRVTKVSLRRRLRQYLYFCTGKASKLSVPAAGALVVEEDAIDGEHVVRLPVVDHAPVGHQLGARIRRAGVEWRRLALTGLLDFAVKL